MQHSCPHTPHCTTARFFAVKDSKQIGHSVGEAAEAMVIVIQDSISIRRINFLELLGSIASIQTICL